MRCASCLSALPEPTERTRHMHTQTRDPKPLPRPLCDPQALIDQDAWTDLDEAIFEIRQSFRRIAQAYAE